MALCLSTASIEKSIIHVKIFDTFVQYCASVANVKLSTLGAEPVFTLGLYQRSFCKGLLDEATCHMVYGKKKFKVVTM